MVLSARTRGESARHVLFYTVRPQYTDMADDDETAEEDSYHPDVQIHAPYLLLAQRPRDKQLARRVKRMYEESGYDLGLHM